MQNLTIKQIFSIFYHHETIVSCEHMHRVHRAKKLLGIEKQKCIEDDSSKTYLLIIKPGEYVMVKRETRRKNESPYHGPLEVLNFSDVNSTIKINGKQYV